MPAIDGGLHTRSFQVVQRVYEHCVQPSLTDKEHKRKRSDEDSLVEVSSDEDDVEPVTASSLLLSDARVTQLKELLEQEFGSTAQDTAQTPHYRFWGGGRCGSIFPRQSQKAQGSNLAKPVAESCSQLMKGCGHPRSMARLMTLRLSPTRPGTSSTIPSKLFHSKCLGADRRASGCGCVLRRWRKLLPDAISSCAQTFDVHIMFQTGWP